jgi:hypothetical protein
MLRYPDNASPQKTLAYAAQNIAEPPRNPPVTLLLRADLPSNSTPRNDRLPTGRNACSGTSRGLT